MTLPQRLVDSVSRLRAILGVPGIMIGVFSLLSFVLGLIVLGREYNRPRIASRAALHHVLSVWVRAPDYLGLTLVDYVDRWREADADTSEGSKAMLSHALDALGGELQRQGDRFPLIRVVALELVEEGTTRVSAWSSAQAAVATDTDHDDAIPLIERGEGLKTDLVVRYRIDPGIEGAALGLEASYHRLILALLGLSGFSLITLGYMILHARNLSERVAREAAQEATLDLADRTCHELGNGVFILANEGRNLAIHLDLLDRFLAEESNARAEAAHKVGVAPELSARWNQALDRELALRGIAPNLELRGSAAIARAVCRQIAVCSEYIALTVRELDSFLNRSTPPVEVGPVSAVGCLDEAVALLRPRLDALEARVIAPVEGSVTVMADRRLLVHALVNLLKNALEAASSANNAPLITLSVQVEGSTAWIEISDNGTGIADADLPRVFDDRFTTKAAGRGRGLAIVKESIHVQKGEIHVSSRRGEGTHFRIGLPVAEGDPTPRNSPFPGETRPNR